MVLEIGDYRAISLGARLVGGESGPRVAAIDPSPQDGWFGWPGAAELM